MRTTSAAPGSEGATRLELNALWSPLEIFKNLIFELMFSKVKSKGTMEHRGWGRTCPSPPIACSPSQVIGLLLLQPHPGTTANEADRCLDEGAGRSEVGCACPTHHVAGQGSGHLGGSALTL